MGRWQPDARGRLERAAMELFLERGYEATTVADIAGRAGLNERTFFRYFADKREVLFADPRAYEARFTDAISAVPSGAAPIRAVEAGLRSAGEMFADRHEAAKVRQRIIDANPALQERELIKRRGLTRAMADALRERGTPGADAELAAEIGATAFHLAFARWLAAPEGQDLGPLAVEVVGELRAVMDR